MMLHHTTSLLLSSFTNSQNSVKHTFKMFWQSFVQYQNHIFLLNSPFIWHKEQWLQLSFHVFVCFVWQVSKDIRHIQRFEWKNCPFSSVSFGAFNSLTIINYQLLLTFNSSCCFVSAVHFVNLKQLGSHCFQLIAAPILFPEMSMFP